MGRSLTQTDFTENLLRRNGARLRRFQHWIFQPGMLFGDRHQWWGTKEARSAPHEGVDFCCYANSSGHIVPLGSGIIIPAVFSGLLVLITSDFLGHSIFLRHPARDREHRVLYSIYGHLTPAPWSRPGQEVMAGETLGAVAPPHEKKMVAPHLHLTIAWIPAGMDPSGLSWAALSRDGSISLCDPQEYVV